MCVCVRVCACMHINTPVYFMTVQQATSDYPSTGVLVDPCHINDRSCLMGISVTQKQDNYTTHSSHCLYAFAVPTQKLQTLMAQNTLIIHTPTSTVLLIPSDLKVLRDSSWYKSAGLIVAIIVVLELPPRLSFSSLYKMYKMYSVQEQNFVGRR